MSDFRSYEARKRRLEYGGQSSTRNQRISEEMSEACVADRKFENLRIPLKLNPA